jgi:hypothetical protein
LASTTGSIALDGTNNDFGVVNASGANIALVDKNALSVTLNTAGKSTLSSAGNLTVSGNSGSLQARSGQSLAVGTITTVKGDVQLDAAQDITLGELNVAGSMMASSTAGNITQTGPLNVAGASDLSAPAGKIDLGNTANKFGGQVTFKSPNTVFAGSGAPSNGLEQAIIASVLAQMAPNLIPQPNLPSQFIAFSPADVLAMTPVGNGSTGPSTGASAATTTGTPPVGQEPFALPLSVGGFRIVEVSSEQLALLQPVPTSIVGAATGARADVFVDIATGELTGGKSQDDAAVRQMVRATPEPSGRVSLFVIDGGIRLPMAAQEERTAPPSNANADISSLKRPQERKDQLQPLDQ